MEYEAVVIGVSWGGVRALRAVLHPLPDGFRLPVMIVQHQSPDGDDYFARTLDEECRVGVKQADDKEIIEPGVVYMATPDYHLLVEDDRSFSFSVDPKVNYARPSIDVFFESAADVYGPGLIGVILTGANADGSRGLRKIRELGGLTIVQTPETAEKDTMPRAAIAATKVHHILPLERIGPFLSEIHDKQMRTSG